MTTANYFGEGGESSRFHTTASFTLHGRFFQLHVAVDGGEFEFASTFADGTVEVATPHAAGDGDGEIGLHGAVHRAGADFRVEVAGDFELDASVDSGEVERAGPIGAAEAREHG